MEKILLYKGLLDGIFRVVEIHLLNNEPDEYSIKWEGVSVGKIKKIDDKWFTSSIELLSAVNEIGKFIDKNMVNAE